VDTKDVDALATLVLNIDVTICNTEPLGTLALVIPLNWFVRAIVPLPETVSRMSVFNLEAISLVSPVL